MNFSSLQEFTKLHSANHEIKYLKNGNEKNLKKQTSLFSFYYFMASKFPDKPVVCRHLADASLSSMGELEASWLESTESME